MLPPPSSLQRLTFMSGGGGSSFRSKHNLRVIREMEGGWRLGRASVFINCRLQSEYRRGLIFAFMSPLHRDLLQVCWVF